MAGLAVTEAGVRREAEQVARLLEKWKRKLVLAESCTGGLVSALLVGIPGISSHFCGSFVVYRNDSKSRWLGVHPELISHYSEVSEEVAREMARGALIRTPEADIAISITGHLGPGAPEGEDGLAYVAVATGKLIQVREVWLDGKKRQTDAAPKPNSPAAFSLRRKRQLLASQVVLQMVRALLTASKQ